MALKALMLRQRIENKKAELEALRGKDAEFETREAELTTAIEEAKSDDEMNAVNAEIDKFDNERSAHRDGITALEADIASMEEELRSLEAAKPAEKAEKKENNERTEASMETINIRSLPMHKRAFDALSVEQRDRIMAQEDVKTFLGQLRSMKGSTRGITGGELTIPIVFLDLIAENVYRYSKLVNRVRVRNVTGQTRQTIAGTVPEAVWTEMCAAINELTFVFNQITLDGWKVAGYVPVCNALLEDSDLNLAATIVEMLSEAIGLAKDKAILYGKGPGYRMPMGIVTRLAQSSQPADYPANAPAWVDLHSSNIKTISADLTGAAFWAALVTATGATFTKYARGEKFWAMNSKTHAMLMSKAITFTASGDVVANVYNTLPIINGNIDILEFIPDGDIIGGYGDLYLWIERSGMSIRAFDQVQALLDNTVFIGKARADGAPAVPGGFVAINIAGQSVTTSMTFAADTANDAKLSGLSVGQTLSPTFDPDVFTYTASAASTVTSDTISAVSAQPDAEVTIMHGTKRINNEGKATWATGANTLTVTVKKGDASRVYTVTVTKASGT